MTAVSFTRRKTLPLLAAATFSGRIREILGQQPRPILNKTTRTLTAEGTDVEMQVTEVQENGGLSVIEAVVRIKNDGPVIFDSQTELDTGTDRLCKLFHRARVGRLIYRIEVIATQSRIDPDAPPDVSAHVVITHPDGRVEKFGGTIGVDGPLAGYRIAPGLDKYLPQGFSAQSAALQRIIDADVVKHKEESAGKFPPQATGQPHSLVGKGCRALCWGVGAIGGGMICGGTFGIGCAAALFAIGAAASLSSEACPA